MGVLFQQADFSGGLNAQLDPTKTPDNSYPLLINGRVRRNVVSPTNKHGLLSAPLGNYQGLYVFGSYLLLFVDGLAYSADITENPILFHPVTSWVAMDSTVERIYAEQVPRTANLFNKQGVPDLMENVFNDALAVFAQAIFCFDGKSAQAVLPNNMAASLGSYDTWTKDNPLYVPAGVLPAFAGNKLYLVAPTLDRVYHSVSGRASDFVVNLDVAGNKGGDADTVSQTVSFNAITALRSLSTGEVLVGTLYGTFALVPDYENKIFGEPYLRPVFLFPAGPVNELSIVDVLKDTAFITQSGIHAFNAVAQAMKESNNFPMGAQIRGLLTDPRTEKAIVQSDTCSCVYDDYALFAVNTIYGYGALVYDTTTGSFHSLDLSFGRVKQFAVTKISGSERVFFITHDNKIYEGFSETEKNTTRLLLGEWTPEVTSGVSSSYMVNSVFTNVRSAGEVKISFYADNVLRKSEVLQIAGNTPVANLPIPLPFITGDQVTQAGFSFGEHFIAWKCAVMLEWNFAGEVCAVSVDGSVKSGDNVRLDVLETGEKENFAFLADSGYSEELNTGGIFVEETVTVSVVKGEYYAYMANGNGVLVNGDESLSEGMFIAKGDTVAIRGTGTKTFSLRPANNYMAVLNAIFSEDDIKAILHGGDFAYEVGSLLDVKMAKLPFHSSRIVLPAPGNHDISTESGRYFFNLMRIPRLYDRAYTFTDFFWFNGNASEPNGISSTSVQAGLVRQWLENSVNPFKILICHFPPYTNDIHHYPGRSDLRYLTELPGLSAIISGHAHSMERFVTNGFPTFVCGTGGHSLRDFKVDTTSAFRNNSVYGYLHITSDALTCRIDFKDTNKNILDSYEIYA